MNYRKSYIPRSGCTSICVPGQEDCSLGMLHFGTIEFEKGEQVVFDTENKEWGLIILSGHVGFTSDSLEQKHVGGRRSVSDGNATSVYLPRNQKVTVSGREYVRIIRCDTSMDVDIVLEIIGPDRVCYVTLGVKLWEREITFIIDGNINAGHLIIGEVYRMSDSQAGFPPHKYDVDQMPDEGVLEEIYYSLFQPSQGFATQKLYTKDGEIDEAYTVKQDELVEFLKGYHTVVSVPGHQTYSLWSMTGEYQDFFRPNDPDHGRVAAVEQMVKKGRMDSSGNKVEGHEGN